MTMLYAEIAPGKVYTVPAEKIVEVMLRNAAIPEERMLKLCDFDAQSVKNLRSSLKALTKPDSVGIRRLEATGVLDLWNVHEDLSRGAPPAGESRRGD